MGAAIVKKSVNYIARAHLSSEHLLPAVNIIEYLQTNNIDPIVYGSTGVSLYLGEYKIPGDIDLLIPSTFLTDKWDNLVSIMEKAKFQLIDKSEHEFRRSDGLIVAFADENVLIRDKISKDLNSDIITIPVKGIIVRTLTLSAFKRAYEFSEKDGYRRDTRGKKDNEVIKLIDRYLTKHPEYNEDHDTAF